MVNPACSPKAMCLLSLVSLGLTASIPRQQNNNVLITIPASVPSTASSPISPNFPGFAFEQASWVKYAQNGLGTTNNFTRNLIASVTSRTGGYPIIRLGGTSPDYGKYIPSQVEPALPVAEQNNFQDVGHTTIGPSFWPLAKNFPNAKYMIQVPLADTNVSEAVAWTKAAVSAIGLNQIHSIQIGNEPDLYRNDFTGEGGIYLGPPRYQGTLDNATYVSIWTKYATAIRKAVALPDRFFTAFDVAAHVEDPSMASWLFDVKTCFGLGIDAGNNVKEVSHHYYQNVAGKAADLQAGLMTLSVTHRNLDYLKPRINWLKANRPNIPFIINELGNSLFRTNSYEYQARLGSALWAVDFYLYSMTIGVAAINYQQIMHSGFDLWLAWNSAGVPAQVFANYYSQPFIADFIGNKGKARVAKLNAAGGPANLAAYAAYEDGVPKRLAIANLEFWNSTAGGRARTFTPITLTVPTTVKSVKLTRLNSPYGAGATADSIAYAGSHWQFDNRGIEIQGWRADTEILTVNNGAVSFLVPFSSAALLYFS
ncbi:uncharacterized protein B0I36DRAFT_327355 [Microdochium trichocladiopsis]|uniref:Beta-glucuronidase C-terminal domain-containing protein n=1 Tax=Microdochium trichocladiopsis TaxID=1682393 RepID=A0A9P9BL01_9PEZI|nr:uncharacterized protein B0I36DRAFT_327355 [Microdochium trichocladiopsis]KAH7027562.1 hypothetical protein B0I36DRAFT_327355 [Microdochium trichocladiopsis]